MSNITVEFEFEVGDVVSLISGGPDMTISAIDEEKGTVTATWFEVTCAGTWVGDPRTAIFNADTLLVEED